MKRPRLPSHALRAMVLTGGLILGGCAADGPTDETAPSRPAPTPESTSVTPPEPDATDPDKIQQAALDEQLRDAAWADDVPRARKLIKRGADVNAKDETEQSAYLISTSEGYLDLLRLTLANGAQVDDLDSFNGTGLIRAAERGHADVVGELLQAGIDPDHVNRLGYQAIHESVWLGEDTTAYVDTIRVLAARGVRLDRASDRQGLTPLEMARQRGYGGLEATIRSALDPATIDDPDATLLRAAAAGDPDLAVRALRAGASIETRNSLRQTPLLLAATEDRVAVARLLVALGADPNAVDHQQDTPWLVTGVTGSVPMLEALLPAEPDLGLLNRYGGTSLIPASERGHVDYVRRVLQTDIDVDHINRLGWTALLEAVILGDGGPVHQKIVALLLDAGADESIPDKDGVTALEHARDSGYGRLGALLRR